jgi:Plasmid encoded RepA protein
MRRCAAGCADCCRRVSLFFRHAAPLRRWSTASAGLAGKPSFPGDLWARRPPLDLSPSVRRRQPALIGSMPNVASSCDSSGCPRTTAISAGGGLVGPIAGGVPSGPDTPPEQCPRSGSGTSLQSCRTSELGNSLSVFMFQLGLNPATGCGPLVTPACCANRCSGCSGQPSASTGRRRRARASGTWLDMQVAPRGEFWWSVRDPSQAALWGSWIELGEKFFEAITAAPVPLDMRALKALKRSPLALSTSTPG